MPENSVDELTPDAGVIDLDQLGPAVEMTTAGLRDQAAQIVSIAATAHRMGIVLDAAEAIRRGIDPAALSASVHEALVARDEATTIVAITPMPSTTGIKVTPGGSGRSPLIAAAERAREQQLRGRDAR